MTRINLRRIWVKAGLYALALVLLGAVFLSYLRADFLVNLADQLWSCF